MATASVRSECSAVASAALLASSTIASLAMATPAQGESAPPAKIESVLVTAQRKSEAAQTVPIALSALDTAQIEALGINTVEDFVAAVPNLQVSMPYGTTQPIFSLRGVSMSDYSSNQPSPIGVYFDEAYLGPVYAHGLALFDVERIEVLRGPQGTLYGKNTTGGAVNVITRLADLDAASGYGVLTLGDYEALGLQGAVSVPLIADRVAVRAAVTVHEDDGYADNNIGARDMAQTKHRAARLTTLARVSDAFDVTLRITSSRSDPRATPPRGKGTIPLGSGVFADFNGYVRPASYDAHEGAWNHVGRIQVDLDQASLRLEHTFGSFALTAVSSWYEASYAQSTDADGSPLNLIEIDWSSDERSLAQDVRIASDLGTLDFIAGAYYQRQDINMYNVYVAYQGGAALIGAADPALQALLLDWDRVEQRMRTERESTALYTQWTASLGTAFSVDAGLRYTDDKDVLARQNLSHVALNGTPLGTWVPGNLFGVDAPFLPPALGGIYTHGPYTTASVPRQSTGDDAWTSRVSLNYHGVDSSLIYLSYSRGHRSGNFNSGIFYAERSLAENYAAAETVHAYELGAKSEWRERRLRLNAAAFYYDYSDQQFVNVVGVSNYLENAGRAEILGAEAEVTALLGQRFALTATLGLLDTRFTELVLANTLTEDPVDVVDLSGNELISAPKVTGALAGDYEQPLTQGFLLRLHADASYRSHQWFSAYNEAIGYGDIAQSAYWLLNARVSLSPSHERWTIAAFVRNARDEQYDTYAINAATGFGLSYFMAGAPRRSGLEMSYRF